MNSTPITVMLRHCALMAALLPAPLATLPAAENDTTPRMAYEVAKPRRLPDSAPKPSDVCYSTRSKHPTDAKDPHDSFVSAQDFHATYFVWVYTLDQQFMHKVKAAGYRLQTALCTILDGRPFGYKLEAGRLRDKEGKLVTAPWMKTFGIAWGCVNSPQYRDIYLQTGLAAIKGGVDAFQEDDPGQNYAALNWGGCYCEYCQKGFEQFQKDHPQGTREDFQKMSVTRFYADMRAGFDQAAGRPVAMSSNNYTGRWNAFPYDLFDFGMAEWPTPSPEKFLSDLRTCLRLGKTQVYTLVLDDVAQMRRSIAMAYAVGHQVIVPWDVYMGTGVPRYFGKPDHFADLYGFVHTAAQYLDGYEYAGAFSPGVPDETYGDTPPIAIRGERVYGILRAIPGGKDKPVTVQLVDWSEKPRAFSLVVNSGALFGDQPIKATLLVPVAYDQNLHAEAEKTRNFAGMCQRIPLGEGYQSTFEIPPLAPWGIVVLEPAQNTPHALWQPAIWADPASLYAPEAVVHMTVPAKHVEIRYTLDGTEPSASSLLYQAPVVIKNPTTFKARSFAQGQQSEPVTARFTPLATVTAALSPNDSTLKANLKLWLSAQTLPRNKVADGAPVATWPAIVGPPAVFKPITLPNQKAGTPPAFAATGLRGKPVVRFNGEDNTLGIEGFAGKNLAGKAFTIFIVSQSSEGSFGIAGNALNGNGGVPRLYLTRESFVYNQRTHPARVGAPADAPSVVTYVHDGVTTGKAYLNGHCVATCEDWPVVAEFGSGAHLSIPFCGGNTSYPGDMAEIVVYDRQLSDSEIKAVQENLARRCNLGTVPQWQ